MIFDMVSCGGWRTCEMACSFHHKGVFVPAISSLKAIDKKDGKGYLISIAAKSDENSLACDGCKDLDVPLCVDYCTESEDLQKILLEFTEKARREGR